MSIPEKKLPRAGASIKTKSTLVEFQAERQAVQQLEEKYSHHEGAKGTKESEIVSL